MGLWTPTDQGGGTGGGGGGSGTVTSVALTGPAELAVAGSPITGAGTLAVTRVNQNANLVMAGPASGAAATPGYRALVTADMPAGTGTVTSVALTVPNILAVAGSPVTTTGTLAVTLATQAANVVLAGPASGGAVAPTFRALVAGDVPVLNQNTTGSAGSLSATLVVGQGGTGLATLATYALLTGGTTGTGNLQQVSGLGTSGQVLTSNGAAALPTWQAAGSAGANAALSNLASVAINAGLATGAGVVFAGSTTAQAAAASTQAGLGLTLAADAAVAGTTNAGAAAGGGVTITAGAAARLTSGNAAGGGITLTAGAGIGTGTAGPIFLNTSYLVQIGGQTNASPALSAGAGASLFLKVADNSAVTNLAAGGVITSSDCRIGGMSTSTGAAGNTVIMLSAGSGYISVYKSGGGASYRFSKTANAENGQNTSLSSVVDNVVTIDTSTPGNAAGWFNYGGTSRVAADLTNATATMANITGLSATLLAGRFYLIRMVIKGVNSQATEGLQFDFNGGTATMTDFWVGAGILASGGTDVIGTNVATSLSGAINFTTFTGESVIVFEGYLKVNAAGTLIPRFAENTSAAGTATVRKGSLMVLVDTP